MNEVDFGKIKQKKVKEFISSYGSKELTDFTKMRPVCFDPAIKESYHAHHESFLIKKDIEHVWNTYKNIHPKEAWNGEMVSFGLQFSRGRNEISYINDDYTGMEKGQVIILNLRLFWGLMNIAVAHEVADVNEMDKSIKLCYMAGGASEGSQWITLHETDDGFTEVSHQTYYKSNSNFRDTRLYPKLHTKAIKEFHNNVKRIAESENSQ